MPVVSSAAAAHELILGRYRPLRPLGSGGMGHVWLARDERSGLDIALKIVAREGKAAVRAEREARAAAALRHSRCQRIYALARDASHVYIAYEYVPGRTMREALAAGPLDDSDALQGGVPLLEAVAPERLLGEPATAAADVWAVGVMLWEALAGRHPLRGATTSETTRLIQAGP